MIIPEHIRTSRYVERGRRAPELDCYGFVAEMLAIKGVDAPDLAIYAGMYPQITQKITEYQTGSPKEWALAAFWKSVNGEKQCHHIGLCIDEKRIAHFYKGGFAITPIDKIKLIGFTEVTFHDY